MPKELYWLDRRCRAARQSHEFTSRYAWPQKTFADGTDDNNIAKLEPKSTLRSLRTLKLCRNELQSFDPKWYPELRTLYIDENHISSLNGVRKLRLLENFSARHQGEKTKTNIAIHGLSELRKVYLSGSKIQSPQDTDECRQSCSFTTRSSVL